MSSRIQLRHVFCLCADIIIVYSRIWGVFISKFPLFLKLIKMTSIQILVFNIYSNSILGYVISCRPPCDATRKFSVYKLKQKGISKCNENHTNVNSVVATEITRYATKNDIHRSSEKGCRNRMVSSPSCCFGMYRRRPKSMNGLLNSMCFSRSAVIVRGATAMSAFFWCKKTVYNNQQMCQNKKRLLKKRRRETTS